MKIDDFKHYDNHNIRLIRRNLVINDLDALPTEITDYIYTRNPHVGNINTRTLRCIHLIDDIIIQRFVNKEII